MTTASRRCDFEIAGTGWGRHPRPAVAARLRREGFVTPAPIWLLTWTTYGVWLPGDDRGFVTTLRDDAGRKYRPNAPGTPYPEGNPALYRYALSVMAGEPVWLTSPYAAVAIAAVREAAVNDHCDLLTIAVMVGHVHVVVTDPADPPPGKLLGRVKSLISATLNDHFGRPPVRWWTRDGSKRKKEGPAVDRAERYVQDQSFKLAGWARADGPAPRSPGWRLTSDGWKWWRG